MSGVSPRVNQPSSSFPGIYLLSPSFISTGKDERLISAGFKPSAFAVMRTFPAVVRERSRARLMPHSTGKSFERI